ncbi:hypothetical protein ACFIQF_02160 [Comamonas sp. J-3]
MITVLLIGLYIPIFTGVDTGDGLGHLAWPAGFVFWDFLAIVGSMHLYMHIKAKINK